MRMKRFSIAILSYLNCTLYQTGRISSKVDYSFVISVEEDDVNFFLNLFLCDPKVRKIILEL